MNSRMKVVLLSAVGMLVSCGLCADEKDRPLETYLPGFLLDSSSDWKKQKADGYQTPKHLQYPYIAMYYLRPTLFEGEARKVSFYMTDFFHSLWRFGDKSKRFDVTLKLTTDGVTFTTKTLKSQPSGNGAFSLGALPVGEYKVGIFCTDRSNGLTSHTVWHEFRVVRKGALDIPSSKVKTVTASDLKSYGIAQDPGYERLVPIEVETDPAKDYVNRWAYYNTKGNTQLAEKYLAFVDGWLKEHPHKDAKVPGYAVYFPVWKGVPLDQCFRKRRLVYDKGYDKEKVVRESEANSAGLQRLLDDARKEGFRKVVLPKGIYRVTHRQTLFVPDGVTLDLNGAALKLNGHIGAHAMMVALAGVTDSHLVNGTVEGDYWEHDYEAKESQSSEWVCGWEIRGASRYCSVENVLTRDFPGYGASNGLGTEGEGERWVNNGRPYSTRCSPIDLFGPREKFEQGGLAADGTVDAKDKAQWTTKFVDIGGFKPWGYLTVSKYLGYQGSRTRNWTYVTAFYDDAKKFISRETCFQYRNVLIPHRAKFARFSIEVASEEEAQKNELTVALFKIPRNCTVAHCKFDHIRCCGHAVSAMSNFLFQENDYQHSGESLVCCALDAEDGGDMMQDALFLKNNFHDNNRNELLTHCGHNFQFVGNHARLSVGLRTFSPFVKGNDCESASFCARSRIHSGYGRYLDNTFGTSLMVGGDVSRDYAGWDVVMNDLTFPQPGNTNVLTITGRSTARFRNCTFKGQNTRIASADHSTFEDCQTSGMISMNGRWTDCTAKNCKFSRATSTNVYVNCSFPGSEFGNLYKSPQRFVNCDLTGTKVAKQGTSRFEYVNCKGREENK